MKEETTILPFRQSEKIDDPLTEIAREGARRMLAEALIAEADAFVASFSEERWPTVDSALSGTVLAPSDGFRPALALFLSRGPKPEIEASKGLMSVRYVSHPVSCLNGRAGHQAWMPFCRRYICVEFPQVIFRRHWVPCLVQTRRTCRPTLSRA